MTYKIKDVTLDERIYISELFSNVSKTGFFSPAAKTLRIALIELEGKELTKENRDKLINELPTDEISDIAGEILAKINHFQDKKK